MAFPSRSNHSKSIFPFNWTVRYIVIAAIFVFLITVWLAFGDEHKFDDAVYNSIHHRYDGLTFFMRKITLLGNTEVLIVANCLLVVFLVINKEKWLALQVTIVALSSVLLMSLLKRLFHRHRPPQPLVEGITNYSFPSGHAFMSLAFYGLIIWWAHFHLKNKTQRRIVIAVFALLVATICYSRVYLRVHYATDVIAGIAASTAWLIISLIVTDRLIKFREV